MAHCLLICLMMPYRPRYQIIWDEAIFHVTWQCHNHQWLIRDDWAKKLYYDLLLKYKAKYRVSFYSYHFMDNHIHLSGKIDGTKEEFSALFQVINSILAKEINKQFKRRGQVILDRFKSPCIQTDQALLAVMHYQDLNSWRVGKVKHPSAYRWSSYRHYAHGEKDVLITDAPSYLGLADTNEERQRLYRQMVERIVKEEGIQKKDYSQVRYIGDPDWVKKREQELREAMKIKREAYLKRQQRIYSQAPP